MSGELIVRQADQNHFSTYGNGAVPGVPGPYEDSDVYDWDGGTFNRDFDATTGGVPAFAGVDALHWVDANHFYVETPPDVVQHFTLEDNQVYFVTFPNPQHAVSSGGLVSIEIDQARVEHVSVQ